MSEEAERDEVALVVVMIGMDELADMRDGTGMRDVDAMVMSSPSALSPVGLTTTTTIDCREYCAEEGLN